VFESLLNAFRAPDIRRRILYVLGILIVFRLLAHVPVPGVDREALDSFFETNQLFGLLDLFSGGGLSNFSVVGLGVNPYINASIIMQLMTGVIPIIFAVSILLFPVQIAQYFTTSQIDIVADIAGAVVTFFSNTLIYASMYFLLTVGFTYFYTAFTFRPDETAEQLRKNGGFIPGIRPGRPTQEYLAKVVTRITLAGALFLGTVAVAPYIVSAIFPTLGSVALGGTSLLIVVSVVVETMKQIEAQLLMRNYEGFIR
jgi:preprotein translocase subunit SecY